MIISFDIWTLLLSDFMAYEVTRGIVMVVGRVPDKFWGVQGGFGGVWGGLFYPYRALFAPLEVLYSTRFGSKHYIMVQLANVY